MRAMQVRCLTIRRLEGCSWGRICKGIFGKMDGFRDDIGDL